MPVYESEIQERIQIEGPHLGTILLRNNSGAFKDQTGRLVRFGLGNTHKKSLKSSDLIGLTTLTITQEMVGKKVGVFTAIEVKEPLWEFKGTEREISQEKFINWVRLRGGIANFCKSVDDFTQTINNYIVLRG